MRAKLALLFLLLSLDAHASDLFAPFQGSRMAGLTRTSTIAEYDSTTDASGNLLDVSGSNYLQSSEALSGTGWTVEATATVTTDQDYCPASSAPTADLLHVALTGAGVYQSVALAAGSVYEPSVWVKRSSTSGTLNVSHKGGTAYGQWTVDLSALPDSWVRLHRTSPYVTVVTSFSLDGSNNAGVYFFASAGTVDFYACAAQVAKVDQWRQGPGVYHPTTSTTKPLHDLAPAASPGSAYSYLQNRDGNRHQARTFSGANYYSVAHHDSMNIFDGDFAITQVVKSPSAAPGAVIMSFSHGTGSTDGMYVQMNTSGYFGAVLNKAGATAYAQYSVSKADGNYHVVQAARRSNVLYLCVDDAIATTVNVSTYGIDANRSMYVGSGNGPGFYWSSDVLYTRVDAAALTQDEQAKEREALQGTLAGSGNLSPGWTFTRTTTASMTYANGTVGYVAANVPRVGGDGGGVLVEEQRENKALQSQTFGTTWTQVALTSISSDGLAAPDGNATADGLIGTAVDTLHGVTQDITLTAATWTASVMAKAGNKDWIYLSDDTVANATSYFNVANCTAGTKGAGATAARAERMADGYCRCWISFTGTVAAHTIKYASAHADSDNDFAGDGATVNTWYWGAQVELGAHPTSLITTTSAAVTRTQDSLTMEPWKLNKGVNPGLANPTMTARFESDVYATGTYTTETGGYAFTAAGDVKRQASQTLGDWFAFDGTLDSLGVTSSAFTPAGNFSISAIVTPATVSGDHIIAEKWVAAGDQRSYQLYHTGADVVFKRSTNGTTSDAATLSSALVANKTSLVTASYDTASGLTVRADALAPATQAGTGAVLAGSAPFQIGGITGYFNGKIHKLDFFSTYALTNTDHTNMYADLKKPNALPVKVGTSYEAKKLYIEYDAKCPFSNLAEAGLVGRIHVNISGNTGTADTNTNNITIYSVGMTLNAYIYSDAEDTARLMSTTLITPNNWHHYKYYLNFADLTTSTGYIDTTAFTLDPSMTGAKNLDLTNTLVRVGQNYSGNALSACRFKNLRVRAAP